MTRIAELQDRLRRLAKRREGEGIYTDAAICEEAAEALSRLTAALGAQTPPEGAVTEAQGWPSKAAADVIAERRRQVEAEGWTPEHDDSHDKGEMAAAAVCYAFTAVRSPHHINNLIWPWASEWWKPTDTRRNLVKAAALIIAEIERLDRLTPPVNQSEGADRG